MALYGIYPVAFLWVMEVMILGLGLRNEFPWLLACEFLDLSQYDGSDNLEDDLGGSFGGGQSAIKRHDDLLGSKVVGLGCECQEPELWPFSIRIEIPAS